MNSTPLTPLSIIRLTALLPPPPTPITLILASDSDSRSNSNIALSPLVKGLEWIKKRGRRSDEFPEQVLHPFQETGTRRARLTSAPCRPPAGDRRACPHVFGDVLDDADAVGIGRVAHADVFRNGDTYVRLQFR